MATLDVISELVQGSDGVPAREVIQGEQFTLTGHLRESLDGSDLDTALYTIEAVAEFYLVAATASAESLTIGGFQRHTSIPDRTLTVTKSGTSFHLRIPHDLYPEDIAPAISSDVPIAVVFVKITHTSSQTIDIGRFLLVYRKGLNS